MAATEITEWTATELSQAIHARQVSCREVTQALRVAHENERRRKMCLG